MKGKGLNLVLSRKYHRSSKAFAEAAFVMRFRNCLRETRTVVSSPTSFASLAGVVLISTVSRERVTGAVLTGAVFAGAMTGLVVFFLAILVCLFSYA